MANVDERPTMGRITRAVAFCALALCVESLGPSCSTGINLGPIRAFNRPVAVAFACIDTSGTAVPIAQCALDQGAMPVGFSMHALVPQESRGEVAAVDLAARTVLDSDRRIPGYTFVPVGALPGPIVVPPNQPFCTYVANRGSNDISVIETRSFRSSSTVPRVRRDPFPLEGSPTDMVLQTDGGVDTALWVALAEEGRVIRLPILGDCQLGAPDLDIDLGTGATVPAGVPVDGTVDLRGTRTCPADFVPVPPAVILPREPDVDPADLAEPAALVVDDEAGVLLVGDRSLPLIHRIVLGDGSVLPPIATGAPVRDVVLTPRVPDSYAPSSDPTTLSRYLYAIDDDDGSIMAIEYSDEARADFGAVIPVDVVGSARPDRIPVQAVARALEVITPQYPTGSGEDPRAGLCDIHLAPVTTPGPNFMRGVFLSIAVADGTVRFVDVYDLDAPCRGEEYGNPDPMHRASCTATPTIVSDRAVYIRRHRPRSSSYSLAFGGVTELPSVLLGAATVPLLANGTAGEGPTVPSLAPLETCPVAVGATEPHLKPVLTPPLATATFACGLTDPFAIVPELWSAAWEGSLPSTGTSGANAGPETAGTIAIDSSTDYCARGAIGALDAVNGLPADAPEAGYAGDLLALTGLLPSGQIDRAICRAVVGVTTVGEPQLPVLVRIARTYSRPADIQPAYVGRLEIGADAPLIDPLNPAGRQFEGRALTIRDALDCYGDQLLTIDVRTSGAYRVLGTRSGFQSRVIRDATDGHCAWDASASVLAQGRAFNGRPFVNARIAFQLTPPAMGVIGNPDVQIEITTNQAPLGTDLSFSASSAARQMALPTYLSWSPQLSRLYAVDVERRGLVEIAVLPLAQSNSRFE